MLMQILKPTAKKREKRLQLQHVHVIEYLGNVVRHVHMPNWFKKP
jgi:hypothetical protein